MSFNTIIYEEDGPIGTITLNRPDDGNMFTVEMCHEIRDCINAIRRETRTRVIVITGAGEKFFCIGGEHDPMTSLDQSQVLPIIDVYQAIDTIPKPVVAAVNGFAVGGGNVLHTVCDLSIASENAVFRQVGPMVGSFDAGYGSWYLEDTIGRKRAKEMWYLNRKYSAAQALAMGLVNEVVAADDLQARAADVAREITTRSPLALAGMKGAFSARHNGVAGQARMAHDQQLTLYLQTREAHEVGESFTQRRPPKPESFWT